MAVADVVAGSGLSPPPRKAEQPAIVRTIAQMTGIGRSDRFPVLMFISTPRIPDSSYTSAGGRF